MLCHLLAAGHQLSPTYLFKMQRTNIHSAHALAMSCEYFHKVSEFALRCCLQCNFWTLIFHHRCNQVISIKNKFILMLFLALIFQSSLFPLFEPSFLHLCRTFLALMPHTQCTHEPTHTSLSHSPGHPHTPTCPHTLLLKKGCSMSMLMCWQWFMLQREAVLLNPNSPGTERIVSSNTATFCSHPTAHPLFFSIPSLANFIQIVSTFRHAQTRRAGGRVLLCGTFYSLETMLWLTLIFKTLVYRWKVCNRCHF